MVGAWGVGEHGREDEKKNEKVKGLGAGLAVGVWDRGSGVY